ncbi:MAG: hypothetical protein CR986_02580 [Ignavibacteriae bacterium]|nr:MAG: hypothetical protein CR986_02580 [Ignavibacteriota bacterium]
MSNNFHNDKIQNYENTIHDLNNLIHNILSSVDLLKQQSARDAKDLNLINNIEQNSILANNIISQLSHNPKTEKNKIELKKLLEEVVALFNNKIKLEFGGDIFFIHGNYLDLKKVIFNLIINSLQAGDNNTIVKISLSIISTCEAEKTKFIRLKISDNGKGIPDEIISKIFNKGFTSKSKNENSGLGLYITKKIIEDHNGWIDVKSSLNKGTTFMLFFPEYKSKTNLKLIKNKKILVAEDNLFQREVLKDLLKSLKVKVFTASNGEEAYDVFINKKPDLIFLDEQMPLSSGLECAKKIRTTNNSSRIVLMTGSEKINSSADDVNKVLYKPYSFDELKETLFELL